MKYFAMICSILGILGFTGITTSFAEAQHDQTIHQMSELVQKTSLQEFLHLIEAHSWKAPEIYSRWHMESKASGNARAQMSASRHFGNLLLVRLSEWRSLMTTHVSSEQLQGNIEHLLTLADWLMKSQGYGNMFLAVRCHDIATGGIGQLLINLDYPLEETQSLIDALDAPWYAPSVRQDILNKEAGVELFVSKSRQEEEILRALQETWQTGSVLQRRQKRQNHREIDHQQQSPPPISEEEQFLETLMTRIAQRGSQVLKDNIRFFEDDRLPEVITTASLWERKWHYKFMIGFTLPNTVKLQALAAFRDAVGFYPEKPVFTEEELKQREIAIQAAQEKGITFIPFEDAFNSPREAAFNQAWRPLATQETYNLDARAWQAYEEIINGHFLDEDSRAELRGHILQRRN